MKIAVIMLAAGNSRRFGSNKLLYPIDGAPMYRRGLAAVLDACGSLRKQGTEVFVTVVSQYEEILDDAERSGCLALRNPHPEDGISSSLRIGLTENRDTDACLFTVADQPWLTSRSICGLVSMYLRSGKGMACLSYEGSFGNPCIFSKKYYGELLSLKGDRGGKRVLLAHPEDVEIFVVKDRKELEDIDFLTKERYT